MVAWRGPGGGLGVVGGVQVGVVTGSGRLRVVVEGLVLGLLALFRVDGNGVLPFWPSVGEDLGGWNVL